MHYFGFINIRFFKSQGLGCGEYVKARLLWICHNFCDNVSPPQDKKYVVSERDKIMASKTFSYCSHDNVEYLWEWGWAGTFEMFIGMK